MKATRANLLGEFTGKLDGLIYFRRKLNGRLYKTIEQSNLGQYCDVLNAQKWGLSDKSGEFGRFCPKTPFWSPHIPSFFRFS